MAKRTNKERLEQDSLRASRIQHTLSTNGWADIKAAIENKYNSLMNDLLEKEDPEARGGINAIIEIMDDISRDLEFGKVAAEKYKKQYLINT